MVLLATALLVAQSFFGGAPIDGIRCDAAEGSVTHIHAHLALFDRGRPVGVPAGIGIPDGANCLYWLHTHTDDGFIHIESPVKKTFTLGAFFDIWGMDLSRTEAAGMTAPHGRALAVWVDGRRYAGDPATIVLRNHETILIESGPPFVKPRAVDWAGL